jgi:hypothetical protein
MAPFLNGDQPAAHDSGGAPGLGAQTAASGFSPYWRTFAVGAVWFAAIALKMVSRHPGHWTTYPPRNFIVLVVGWIITALLLGVASTWFQRLRSWWTIIVGTVAGSFVVLGLMLVVAEHANRPSPAPQFTSTDEMMAYFATEATKWVKKDRGIDLDYTIESIKTVEEELGRVSKEVNPTKPQRGTFGLATGYGAYIGEVFRRRDVGSWAVDHPTGGPQSYPLTTKSNSVIFPVGWCWKRLINGEEDDVYLKAILFSEARMVSTNSSDLK